MTKTFLLSTFLIFSCFIFSQNGQLDNGDFENWEMKQLFQTPDEWNSSNTVDYTGEANILKSSDGTQGGFSALINVKISHGDTLGGYLFHGHITQNGPTSGIDYNSNFNELQLDIKSNLGQGDTLYYLIARFDASGGIIDQNMGRILTQNLNTWESKSIPIPSGTQSKLFIGFILNIPNSNFFSDINSHTQIDNIKLLNNGNPAADLPNFSFENWNTITQESPVSWYTFNPYLYQNNLQNAVKSTDAANGNFALRLSTINVEGSPVQGVVSNSPVSKNLPYPWKPIPYNATPTNISGNYKYTTAFNDHAYIQVEFFQLGNLIGNHQVDFIPQSSYTYFNESLIINGAPDSMSIMAYSGDFENSFLYLDDLSLSGGNVGTFEKVQNNIRISPNPADNELIINLTEKLSGELKILDFSGQEINTFQIQEKSVKLDISKLNTGVYFLIINSEKGAHRTRFVKN